VFSIASADTPSAAASLRSMSTVIWLRDLQIARHVGEPGQRAQLHQHLRRPFVQWSQDSRCGQLIPATMVTALIGAFQARV
jgi:hypothetical protein